MHPSNTWAIVRETDGMVVNIIRWNGVTPYAPPAGTRFVNVEGKHLGPGWTANADGTFNAPPQPAPQE